MAPLDSIGGVFENIAGYLRYFYGYISLRLFLFYNRHRYNCEYEIFGNASTAFSFPFYELKNASIIEDGFLNYSRKAMETHKINPIIDKILHICGMYYLRIEETLGSHKNIKKVYLTNEHDDELINEKIEVIDIEKLWAEKSDEEKRKILSLFNIDYDAISKIGDDSVLILTQPLSEANFITEDEEMDIYRNMIAEFSSRNVFVKPHPRESKDYKAIFPEVEVISNLFPIEFLKLLGIRPKVVGTIISTVALSFKDGSEIYIYDGPLYSDKLENYRKTLIELLNEK
ncbi:glycosyltransferase family 52 [Methanobrevibacter sp.]|uniref:glycosyltransferase family 52 n=1 Tax=Methanobrevibacter sp. TaxID=66852 RepID=UPI0026DFFA73|nr:glycosyltransferase family 52 [Methanobrevibacter sp.]